MPRMSPAMQLLSRAWNHEGAQNGHSWERLNSCMHQITAFAIRYGFRFAPDDFKKIATEFRIEHWGTNDGHMLGEGFYAIACGAERGRTNPSAAISFEQWKGRKPFMLADDHLNAPTRMYVGRSFRWRGQDLTCTSIAEDGESFTACEYKWTTQPDGNMVQKIKRRLRITRADIAAQAKAVRDAKKAAAERDNSLPAESRTDSADQEGGKRSAPCGAPAQ